MHREFLALKYLHEAGVKCIPPAAAYGSHEGREVLLVQFWDNPLSYSDLLSRKEELFRVLAEIHQAGIVHCDVKPQHFGLIGDRVVLIDFDLCFSLSEKVPNLSVSPVKFSRYLSLPNDLLEGLFRGTPLFAPVNSHFGYVPSPGGDFESLCYCLLHIGSGPALPWYEHEGNSVGDRKIMTLLKPPPNTPIFTALRALSIASHTSLETQCISSIVSLMTGSTKTPSKKGRAKETPSPPRNQQLSPISPRPEKDQSDMSEDAPAGKFSQDIAEIDRLNGGEQGKVGMSAERKFLVPALAVTLQLEEEKLTNDDGDPADLSILCQKLRPQAKHYEIDCVGEAKLSVLRQKLQALPFLEATPKSTLIKGDQIVSFVGEAVAISTAEASVAEKLVDKLAQLQWSLAVRLSLSHCDPVHPLQMLQVGTTMGAMLLVGCRHSCVDIFKAVKMSDLNVAFPFLRVAALLKVLFLFQPSDKMLLDKLFKRTMMSSLSSAVKKCLIGEISICQLDCN